MALFTMSFLGVAPLGNLCAGALAHHLGVPATLFAGGAVTVLAALLLAKPLAGVREHLEKAAA
jgi:fucose permease